MSTIDQLELMREERNLLELLSRCRLLQVKAAEAESELFMQGERRVEALNEQIGAKVSQACAYLALGVHGSTLTLLDRLIEHARNVEARCEELERQLEQRAAPQGSNARPAPLPEEMPF